MFTQLLLQGLNMLKLIKWLALIIVAPVLVILEVWNIIKGFGFEIGDPDDLLNQAKTHAKEYKEDKQDNNDIIIEE